MGQGAVLAGESPCTGQSKLGPGPEALGEDKGEDDDQNDHEAQPHDRIR